MCYYPSWTHSLLSIVTSFINHLKSTLLPNSCLSATSLFGLIWISLPEGDKEGVAFENCASNYIFSSDNLHTEWCPCLLCNEVLCNVVTEAAVICNCGGTVVYVQGSFSRSDFQLLVSNSRYIHRQHHVGMLEALPDKALQLCRPAVFTKVSWEEKFYVQHTIGLCQCGSDGDLILQQILPKFLLTFCWISKSYVMIILKLDLFEVRHPSTRY